MKTKKEYEIFKESYFFGKKKCFVALITMILLDMLFIWLSFSLKTTPEVRNQIIINNNIFEYSKIFTVLYILISISFFILLLYVNFTTSKRKFYLFNDKIETKYNNKVESSILINDIKEIYRFRSFSSKNNRLVYGLTDSIAYRKDINDFWITIQPFLKKGFKNQQGLILSERIINKFVEFKVKSNINDLYSDKVVNFSYFTDKNTRRIDEFDKMLFSFTKKPQKEGKNFENTRKYGKINYTTIVVDKESIIYLDKKIKFEKGDILEVKNYEFEENNIKPSVYHVEKELYITDKNNIIKLNLDLACLINSDLFITLLNSIYENINKEGNLFFEKNETNKEELNVENEIIHLHNEDQIVLEIEETSEEKNAQNIENEINTNVLEKNEDNISIEDKNTD